VRRTTFRYADGVDALYAPRRTVLDPILVDAAGVIPTNDGQACVFVSASPRRIGRGGWQPLHRIVAESWPDLAARLAAATPPRTLRTFTGQPGYIRRSSGRGWALVGDAGYFKDPLTSHGMTDALRDAELLARALAAIVVDGADEREALAHCQRTRDALSVVFFDVTDVIAGHRWILEQIPDLLRRAHTTTAGEVEALAALPPIPPQTEPSGLKTQEISVVPQRA